MFLYIFFLISFLSGIQAITKKDLPKLPQPVNYDNFEEKKKITKSDDDDIILSSIDLEESIKDLNKIEWNSKPKKETKPQDNENTLQKPWAPGLKKHENPSIDVIPDLPEPPKLLLKGLVLIGDDQLALSQDFSTFYGFNEINLDPILQDQTLGEKLINLYCGKQLDDKTVFKIQKYLEDYYVNNEIAFVSVTIPKQDISTQVLALVVKVATLQDIKLSGNRFVDDIIVYKELNLEINKKVDIETFDRDLAFFNLNPFHQAKVQFLTTNQPGLMTADIYMGDRYPFRIYAGIDNRGLELLGPVRSYYGLNYSGIFDINDIVSFQYTASLDFSRYQSFTAEYLSFFSPSCILKVFGGYVYDKYIQNDTVDNEGHSSQISAFCYLPWILKKNYTFQVGLGVDYKSTNNNLEYVEYDPVFAHTASLTQLTAELQNKWNYEYFNAGVTLTGVVSLGNIFGNSSTNIFQQLRPGANPHYAYLKGQFDMQWNMFSESKLIFKAQGQYASTNLLPSEEFAIGGLDTVRGYIENAAVGDNGYLISAEWSMPPIHIIRPRFDRTRNTIQDDFIIAGFFDLGEIYAKEFYNSNKLVQPNKAILYSIGPKLIYKIADYLYAETNIGFKLKDTYLDPTSTCKINFLAEIKF